ncbi:conserved hypothetical protein [Streptomyces scabiei 87.22]|uniref:Uncharacterized protein n=1 Tax=Streptomyces scabiei (strain 87.22) TaxID=680198 RepID=C9ZAF6_STRSW|nr:conserved hypothetical protein [Streptomyces scabiei 87.22]
MGLGVNVPPRPWADDGESPTGVRAGAVEVGRHVPRAPADARPRGPPRTLDSDLMRVKSEGQSRPLAC